MELDPVAALADAQRRLRRRALLVLAIAAAVVIAGAALAWWRTRPGPAVPPIARPYLWRVEGAHPSYLLGTLHIAYGFDDLPAGVRAAYARATTVVVESDLLADGDGRPLPPHAGRDRLTPDEWRRLARMTGDTEATLATLPTSWLVGRALASQTPAVEPMDRGIQARAAKAGKALVFLETRQLEAVTDGGDQAVVGEDTLLTQLRLCIAHPAALRTTMLRVVRAYASGGDAGCTVDALGGLVDQLNDDWLAAIEAPVRRGDAFVAIGCAHLAGDDGVVERLRARGFVVERVDR